MEYTTLLGIKQLETVRGSREYKERWEINLLKDNYGRKNKRIL